MPLTTYDEMQLMNDEEWQQFVISIGYDDLTKLDLEAPRTSYWLMLISLAEAQRDAKERLSTLAAAKRAKTAACAPPAPNRPITPAERGIARVRERREQEQRPPPENPDARREQDEAQEALARVDVLLEAERRLAAHANPHAEARRLQPDDSECCICLAPFPLPALLALVPCGHRCVCAACVSHLKGVCPICRTEFTNSVRVFD